MTSNIGASKLQSNRISWQKKVSTSDVINHFINAVQKHFRPELFNRIDQVIPFAPLDKDSIRLVVDREIELLKNREGLRFRNMEIDIGNTVLDFLGEKGYHQKYGARYLQRTIRELLTIPLAKALNQYEYDDRLMINITIVKNRINIVVKSDPLGLELWLETLDKINLADHASELRREINVLEEGHFYVRFLSELDILELQKRKQKEAFWKNSKLYEQYTYYLKTRKDVSDLSQIIVEYEKDLSMTVLGIKPYYSNYDEKLKQWKKQFFNLKIDLYLRRNKSAAKCFVGIYGTQLMMILDFYESIFLAKQFKWTAYSIWYRENYTSELTSEEEKENSNSNSDYVKIKMDTAKKWDFQPDQKGDLLYGIELEITGTCPYLYLKEEEGLHRWKLPDKTNSNYAVRIWEKGFETPTNIHRKEFYKQNPKRVIEPLHLKDTHYKIKRELPKGKHYEIILEELDKRFSNKLNAELR